MPLRGKLSPKIFLFAIAAFFVLGYAYYRTKDLIKGPIISLTAPENGAVIASPELQIEGTAKNNSALTLNGKAIFTDKSGAFSEKTLLLTGYNLLTISAEDRFGRTAIKKIEVVRK